MSAGGELGHTRRGCSRPVDRFQVFGQVGHVGVQEGPVS
jgi:hypothetical protein